MRKYLLVFIFMLTTALCIAQDTETISGEQESFRSMSSSGSAGVEDLFKDSTISELPAPVFKEPSSFIVWLRSTGIAVIDKCLALKAWFAKKYKYYFYKPRATELP